MPKRTIPDGNFVFHVMNRSARRLRLFEGDNDYQEFLACVLLGLEQVAVRLLAYCIMPNHFHLIVWPHKSPELSDFMRIVTGAHGRRWQRRRRVEGTGCVYQGRFRAVVVRRDSDFLAVCRYVERNALRAGLVTRAEEWPWSSLYQRCRNCHAVPLHPWPIPQPTDWLRMVNDVQSESDVNAVRSSIGYRPRGRPRKGKVAG